MKCENICPVCFRVCNVGEQDHEDSTGILTVHQCDMKHWFWYYTVEKKRKVIYGLLNLRKTGIKNVKELRGKSK